MPKLPILAIAGTRRRWTSTDARLILKAQATSGLSVNAFATHVRTPTFVEVMPRSAPAAEVVLRSGRILRISPTIDTPTLRRLVEALEDDTGC